MYALYSVTILGITYAGINLMVRVKDSLKYMSEEGAFYIILDILLDAIMDFVFFMSLSCFFMLIINLFK